MKDCMRGWTIWMALLAMLALTASASACGDTPTEDSPVNNAGEDTGGEDVGDPGDPGDTGEANDPGDTGDPADSNDPGEEGDVGDSGEPNEPDDEEDGDGEVCEPHFDECPANSCGMVDNGCGEFTYCGECHCMNGEPVEETCGVCNLGVRVCGEDENGEGFCDMPDVQGITEALCDSIVYVDPTGSGGNGTREAPLSDFTTAMELATGRETRTLVVAATPDGEPIATRVGINHGLQLLGGYQREGWVRQPSERTEFYYAGGSGVEVTAMWVWNVQERVYIDSVIVSSGVNYSRGASMVGVSINDSSDVVLHRVEVLPGAGSAGRDGNDGSRGSSGTRGINAHTNSALTAVPPAEVAVNEECPGVTSGGMGGRGGHYGEDVFGNFRYLSPSSGQSRNGVQGGAPGQSAVSPAGGDGGRGVNAEGRGDNGAAGAAGGVIFYDAWTSEGFGLRGATGPSGGGGAGGGGSYQTEISLTYLISSAGGGGGSGGCGGEGGEGGGPGGASFGLRLLRSNVFISESSFVGNLGGNGGNAGKGGLGGIGGAGGSPAARHCESSGTCRDLAPRIGGMGGHGGNGAPGGHGGGGAGGDSYGVYCLDSTLAVGSDVSFIARGGGQGGHSLGNIGENGRAYENFGCDL